MEEVPYSAVGANLPEDAPRIGLALFAYREVLPMTVRSLLRDLTSHPEIRFVWAGNDALIDRTRSTIATYFVDNSSFFNSPGAPLDVLVMVDHDVSWEEGDVQRIAQQAHETGWVVSGVYPKRGFSTALPLRSLSGSEFFVLPSDKVIRCEYVSAGFMAIPRNILKALIAPPNYEGEVNYPFVKRTISGFFPFFLPRVVELPDGACEELSEDWSLCHRVRAAGYQVAADCLPRLKHTGPYPFRTIDSLSLPPEDDVVEIQEHNPIIAR